MAQGPGGKRSEGSGKGDKEAFRAATGRSGGPREKKRKKSGALFFPGRECSKGEKGDGNLTLSRETGDA